MRHAMLSSHDTWSASPVELKYGYKALDACASRMGVPQLATASCQPVVDTQTLLQRHRVT